MEYLQINTWPKNPQFLSPRLVVSPDPQGPWSIRSDVGVLPEVSFSINPRCPVWRQQNARVSHWFLSWRSHKFCHFLQGSMCSCLTTYHFLIVFFSWYVFVGCIGYTIRSRHSSTPSSTKVRGVLALRPMFPTDIRMAIWAQGHF